MSTRIRYANNGAVLTSRRVFTVTINGTAIDAKVNLDTANMSYMIVNASTGESLLVGGSTKNLSVLKIQAKEGLKTLGYEFGSETRDRTPAQDVV